MSEALIIQQGDRAIIPVVIDCEGFDPVASDFYAVLRWGFFGKTMTIEKSDMVMVDGQICLDFDTTGMLGGVAADYHYTADGEEAVDTKVVCFIRTSPSFLVTHDVTYTNEESGVVPPGELIVIQRGDEARIPITIECEGYTQATDDFYIILSWGLLGEKRTFQKSDMLLEGGQYYLSFDTEDMLGTIVSECHFFIPVAGSDPREEVDRQPICVIRTSMPDLEDHSVTYTSEEPEGCMYVADCSDLVIIQQGDQGKFQIVIDHDDFDQDTDNFFVTLKWGLMGESLTIQKADMLHQDERWLILFDTSDIAGNVTAECHYFIGVTEVVDSQIICRVSTSEYDWLCSCLYSCNPDDLAGYTNYLRNKVSVWLKFLKGFRVAEDAEFDANVKTSNFETGTTGWQIDKDGNAELETLKTRDDVEVGDDIRSDGWSIDKDGNAELETLDVRNGLTVFGLNRVDAQGNPLLNYIDCGEWETNKTYLCNEMNDDTNQLETHDVWHDGARWRCVRHQPVHAGGGLVYYEPKWNSTSWVMLEGNSNLGIEFLSTNGYTFFRGAVNTVVTPHFFYGPIDISSDLPDDLWSWTRKLEDGTTTIQDQTWNSQHSAQRVLTLTDFDMPAGWGRNMKAVFTCTVTLNDGRSTVVVSNFITA